MSNAFAISLRPCAEADIPALFQIYATTRETELALVDWSPEQKHAFLAMQFHAQHLDYTTNYPAASFWVVEVEGKPVGRLYLDRRETEYRVLDIAIHTRCRGAGIGTQLLKGVIHDASSEGKPVTIHVEKRNPALRLYQRLGFVEIASDDLFLLMERLPDECAGKNE